jgi:hypothetical protein
MNERHEHDSRIFCLNNIRYYFDNLENKNIWGITKHMNFCRRLKQCDVEYEWGHHDWFNKVFLFLAIFKIRFSLSYTFFIRNL